MAEYDTWIQKTASAGWAVRGQLGATVLPDNSLIIAGGYYNVGNTTYHDVWRSTDGGANWAQKTAAAGWTARQYLSLVALPNGNLVVMGGMGSDFTMKHDVWISTDQGANWTQQTAAAGWSARIMFAAVALPDGSIVVAGGVDSGYNRVKDVWRSTDGGVNWTQMSSNAEWDVRNGHTMVALPNGNIILMGGANGSSVEQNDVWVSTNNGTSWTQKTAAAGWTARVYLRAACNGSKIVMCGGSNGGTNKHDVWESTDSGANWTQLTDGSWAIRNAHGVGILADGTLVVMGGAGASGYYNDVWSAGATLPAPVAAFSGTPLTGEKPLSVTFTDSSTNSPTSWLWDFGDGGTSTTQDPSHNYTKAGIYTVTLTATNASGSDSEIKSGYITVSDQITGVWIDGTHVDEISGINVHDKVGDKMAGATLDVIGDTFATYTSGIFFKKTEIRIPDYTGTLQTVFVGIIPSADGIDDRPVGGSESLTAYDYGWYLTNQRIEFINQTLLTPAHQIGLKIYQLEFDTITHHFLVGDMIIGAVTGHIGWVWEVHEGTPNYIRMHGPTGIYQDNEALQVGGVTYALADGHAVDVTGTLTTVYPDNWVNNVLGGTNWATQTGVNPFKLTSTSSIWGVTIPAADKIFEESMMKSACIDSMAKDLMFMFERKPVYTGGEWVCGGYFIAESAIDDATYGLDLPTPITFTPSSPYIKTPITHSAKGESKYNRITVRCPSIDGKIWYQSVVETSGVTAGTEIPIDNPDPIDLSIATQSDCDAKATDLYNYYHYQVTTWHPVFLQRSDLRKYQKLTLTGFGTQLPNGDYRIIEISYDYRDAGNVNEQTCTIILDSNFQSWLNMNRIFLNTLSVINSLIQDAQSRIPKAENCTVNAIDSGIATVTNTRGQVRNVPDGS